jgi:hypothetical protein
MAISITNGYGANPYAGASSATGANTAATITTTPAQDDAAAASRSTSSVNITLSAEAKAALAAQTDTRTADGVATDARAAIDKLLADAKATTALKDGKATISMDGLDRRSLYAVSANQGGQFSTEEQVVAALALRGKSDTALAAPAAAMRVTGDYAGLYQAALGDLEKAGPEERATPKWTQDRAALTEGLKQAVAKPGAAPTGIAGDPVASYLQRVGGVVANPASRDIDAVASDVRAVLDRQYATATADGAAVSSDEGTIDFSKFDNRSLAAVALNKGGQFSEHEIDQAAAEVKTRNKDSVMSAYSADGGSGFGKSIITQYAAMSPEERDASGWTPEFYAKIVSLQNMSDKLASMFNPDGTVNNGGAMSLLDYM